MIYYKSKASTIHTNTNGNTVEGAVAHALSTYCMQSYKTLNTYIYDLYMG